METATGYLTHAVHADNPFRDLFLSLAGLPAVDFLVIWGLALTGIRVMFGAALRFNAFWASVMMLFFWASALQGGLLSGFPVEHGWVVTYHLIYAVLLMGLASFGAGQILGVDGWLRKKGFVKKKILGQTTFLVDHSSSPRTSSGVSCLKKPSS